MPPAPPAVEKLKARNLYEALLLFADANRAMLEAHHDGSGTHPMLLSWNELRKDYRALFGSQH